MIRGKKAVSAFQFNQMRCEIMGNLLNGQVAIIGDNILHKHGVGLKQDCHLLTGIFPQ